MHTLDKDCWYPLWKLMKSQCDILISRASKWCKILMEKGGSDTTDTTQLFLSLDLKAPWEGDPNHPVSVQGKLRHSALQRCNLRVWDGVQLPQPQANLTLTDHTSPRAEMGSAMGRRSVCAHVFVCGCTGFTERRIPDTITNREEINSMVSWESRSCLGCLEFKGHQWTQENTF